MFFSFITLKYILETKTERSSATLVLQHKQQSKPADKNETKAEQKWKKCQKNISIKNFMFGSNCLEMVNLGKACQKNN